jgi:uncharacterized protein
MKDFLTAVALALTMEGVLYALFPNAMKRMMAALLMRPEQDLRWVGVAVAILGVAAVAALKRG